MRLITIDDRPARLVELARKLACDYPNIGFVKVPPRGTATRSFMELLRSSAELRFNHDFSEKRICGQNSLAVDFYFPEERTIAEVALGLPNDGSEFEKDVLKALMAIDSHHAVERLVLISRAGGELKCREPGRSAAIRWAQKAHGLTIEVYDLPGTRRMRTRSRRAAHY